MDSITKTGYKYTINESKPVFVRVCDRCKEAFRTNEREEKQCGDCTEYMMDYEWINGSDCHDF